MNKYLEFGFITLNIILFLLILIYLMDKIIKKIRRKKWQSKA